MMPRTFQQYILYNMFTYIGVCILSSTSTSAMASVFLMPFPQPLCLRPDFQTKSKYKTVQQIYIPLFTVLAMIAPMYSHNFGDTLTSHLVSSSGKLFCIVSNTCKYISINLSSNWCLKLM